MTRSRQVASGVTIYSVAERAGVSIATVSRVIQRPELVAAPTRQRVTAAIESLHYVPVGAARSLAVRQHEAHGLVLPELSGPYYAELLMGFEARAAELGQSVVLLLADTKSDPGRAAQHLSTHVDGLAVFGNALDPSATARLLKARKPVVVIAGRHRPGIESIGAENSVSAGELTEHLLAHGRKRLLFVGDPAAATDIASRYEGFVQAHRRRRRKPMAPVPIEFREKAGLAFADQMLAGAHRADALVCANDELALSIMTRLQDAGCTVPDDVAVVGWDDVMAARYVRPGLTTVRQPVAELGRLAAERLHELVNGTTPESQPQVLPTRLVLRQSCGCPPGGIPTRGDS